MDRLPGCDLPTIGIHSWSWVAGSPLSGQSYLRGCLAHDRSIAVLFGYLLVAMAWLAGPMAAV